MTVTSPFPAVDYKIHNLVDAYVFKGVSEALDGQLLVVVISYSIFSSLFLLLKIGIFFVHRTLILY